MGRIRMQIRCLDRILVSSLLLTGWILAGSLASAVIGSASGAPQEIDFNRQIRPLLSDRCYRCHGADEAARKAGLRLDLEPSAFAPLRSGAGVAIQPSSLEKSVLWERIQSSDPDFQMPPRESHLDLNGEEKALIGQWIEQGARWERHWAFAPVQDPAIPSLDSGAVPLTWLRRNGIDGFVHRRLTDLRLEPSPEAEKTALLRRLSFDLRGLPPSMEEVEAFLLDSSPMAYEKCVDAFLASDACAERLALEWLDVARYGDTQGMHGDRERYHWPWRDWVIDAFRRNLPYDEFITWQLAGDLLPEATQEQRLATAFHRNHPVSAEGGIIDEEFRIKYVRDRVNTTATAFLGLTLECATCHDHKFDPISQENYYQMAAFFNNLKELGMVAEGGGSSGPVLLLPDPDAEEALAEVVAQIADQRERLARRIETGVHDVDWVAELRQERVAAPVPDGFFPLDSLSQETVPVKGAIHRAVRGTPIDKVVDGNWTSVASGEPELVPGRVGQALRLDREYDLIFLRESGRFEVNEPFSASAWIRTEKEGANQTIMGISGDLTNQAWRGWDFFLDPENRPSLRLIGYWPHNYLQVTAKIPVPVDAWKHVAFTYDGSGAAEGVRLYVNGQSVEQEVDYDHLYRTIVHPWGEQEGWPQKPVMVGRSGRFYTGENGVFVGSLDHLKLFRVSLTAREMAASFGEAIGEPADESSLPASDVVRHHLLRADAEARDQLARIRRLVGRRLELLRPVPEIMVMEEQQQRRKTFVLDRGQYNAPTTEVQPGTPAEIYPFASRYPRNRLGLAQWMTEPEHPLTARVTVNRYWQMLFGRGLVETPHDFGAQGTPPSHPALLDWLASRLVKSGWDLRHVLRLMVTSATYRQSSKLAATHRAIDPENRLWARGPSYRLPAEMIRDNALAASGLLVRHVGGPSVKPYQPDGLWVEKTGPGNRYQHDSGERLYRRSLYTYVRRTTPHPAMIAFDAPNRSVCVVKRENTNTPLQALVLLNDPQFVEAARALAQRAQREGGPDVDSQIRFAFRALCGRPAHAKELGLLREQFDTAEAKYAQNEAALTALVEVGELPADPNQDPVRTAALTLVVNTLMNFDAAYMKR